MINDKCCINDSYCNVNNCNLNNPMETTKAGQITQHNIKVKMICGGSHVGNHCFSQIKLLNNFDSHYKM